MAQRPTKRKQVFDDIRSEPPSAKRKLDFTKAIQLYENKKNEFATKKIMDVVDEKGEIFYVKGFKETETTYGPTKIFNIEYNGEDHDVWKTADLDSILKVEELKEGLIDENIIIKMQIIDVKGNRVRLTMLDIDNVDVELD